MASDHAPYDHCAAKYLKQVGVQAATIRLAGEGIHGNGHMIMPEKNSDGIAATMAVSILRVRYQCSFSASAYWQSAALVFAPPIKASKKIKQIILRRRVIGTPSL